MYLRPATAVSVHNLVLACRPDKCPILPGPKTSLLLHVRNPSGRPKRAKKASPPTSGQFKVLASVALGEEGYSQEGGDPAEMTLISLGESEMVPGNQVPANTKK